MQLFVCQISFFFFFCFFFFVFYFISNKISVFPVIFSLNEKDHVVGLLNTLKYLVICVTSIINGVIFLSVSYPRSISDLFFVFPICKCMKYIYFLGVCTHYIVSILGILKLSFSNLNVP